MSQKPVVDPTNLDTELGDLQNTHLIATNDIMHNVNAVAQMLRDLANAPPSSDAHAGNPSYSIMAAIGMLMDCQKALDNATDRPSPSSTAGQDVSPSHAFDPTLLICYLL
jgi:hypothetical protein